MTANTSRMRDLGSSLISIIIEISESHRFENTPYSRNENQFLTGTSVLRAIGDTVIYVLYVNRDENSRVTRNFRTLM